MRYLLALFFSIPALSINAQNLGFANIGYTQETFEKFIDKEIRQGKNDNAITFSSKTMKGDTLIYIVRNNAECFTSKSTFNYTDTLLNEKQGDYQEFIFDCTACAEKHLKELIGLYNMRKEAEGLYLSSYLYSMQMVLQPSSKNPDRIVMTFRKVDMPKKEYKKRYKILKKALPDEAKKK